MRNKDIEKNIKSAMSSSKSRIWDKVQAQIGEQSVNLETVTATGNGGMVLSNNKPFMYSLCVILIAIIVAVSVFVPKLFKKPLDFTGSFFMDINPSVQFTVDKDGFVTDVVPLNQDALVLLQGLSDYKGKSGEEVALSVWELAYKSGYISPSKKDNAVLITGSLIDESLNGKFGLKIKESLTAKIKEKGVYCAVLTDSLNQAVKQTATEYGISPSKYQLIKSATDMGVKIDVNEYVSISVTEINERIKEFGKNLDTYAGMDYEGAFGAIRDLVEEQLEEIIDELGECIQNIRDELVPPNGGEHGRPPHEHQRDIERELENLEDVLEDIEERFERGMDTIALFDKLDRSIASLLEKEPMLIINAKLISLQTRAKNIIYQFDLIASNVETARGEIKDKYDRFVAQTEQAINEHVKQDGFDKDYERWLSEVYEDYRENWEKNKSDWQSGRN